MTDEIEEEILQTDGEVKDEPLKVEITNQPNPPQEKPNETTYDTIDEQDFALTEENIKELQEIVTSRGKKYA